MMIKIIGKKNCSRCNMVQQILTNRNIDFQYELLEDLTQDKKENYIQLAKENNIMQFPLIIKENKIIELNEVI